MPATSSPDGGDSCGFHGWHQARRGIRSAPAPSGLLLMVGLAFLALAEAGPRDKDTVPRTELSSSCSRSVARNVRKAIDKEVLKVAAKVGIDKWPADCPFEPGRDIFFRHEKQKQRKRTGGGSSSHNGQWTCGFCGKKFKNEHYLDLHMERKHQNETPSGGVCLSNYCEVFDSCYSDFRPSARRVAEETCNPDELAKARRRCEDAMTKCLPLENEVSRKLHGEMSRKLCQVLDCRLRAEHRKEREAELVPTVVLLILIVLLCFIVFSVVVCCVDYSEDIFRFLIESRLASVGCVKRMIQAREKTRQAVGVDRTKCI